jgi:hypothetical protein
VSGEETKDELDRIYLWDVLFKYSGSSVTDLKQIADDDRMKLSVQRIRALLDHDWFTMQLGVYYVAMVDGCRRRAPLVSAN